MRSDAGLNPESRTASRVRSGDSEAPSGIVSVSIIAPCGGAIRHPLGNVIQRDEGAVAVAAVASSAIVSADMENVRRRIIRPSFSMENPIIRQYEISRRARFA